MSNGLVRLRIWRHSNLLNKSVVLHLSLIKENFGLKLEFLKIGLKFSECRINTNTILFIHFSTCVISIATSHQSVVDCNPIHINGLPKLTRCWLCDIEILGIIGIGDTENYGCAEIRR